MKKGFTLIELIFVIVILGILGAVAIPKMMATRDDAKANALLQEITRVPKDVQLYVMSTGKTDNNFTKMSDTIRQMISKNPNSWEIRTGNAAAVFMTKGDDDVYRRCIWFQLSNDRKILSVNYNNGGNICSMIQKRFPKGPWETGVKFRIVE